MYIKALTDGHFSKMIIFQNMTGKICKIIQQKTFVLEDFTISELKKSTKYK